MSDTKSEHYPPFRNVSLTSDLEENVKSLTKYSTAFHIRLLRELLQPCASKNYAVSEIASMRPFRTEQDSVLGSLRHLQHFKESAITRFQRVEEKMEGASDRQSRCPLFVWLIVVRSLFRITMIHRLYTTAAVDTSRTPTQGRIGLSRCRRQWTSTSFEIHISEWSFERQWGGRWWGHERTG